MEGGAEGESCVEGGAVSPSCLNLRNFYLSSDCDSLHYARLAFLTMKIRFLCNLHLTFTTESTEKWALIYENLEFTIVAPPIPHKFPQTTISLA